MLPVVCPLLLPVVDPECVFRCGFRECVPLCVQSVSRVAGGRSLHTVQAPRRGGIGLFPCNSPCSWVPPCTRQCLPGSCVPSRAVAHTPWGSAREKPMGGRGSAQKVSQECDRSTKVLLPNVRAFLLKVVKDRVAPGETHEWASLERSGHTGRHTFCCGTEVRNTEHQRCAGTATGHTFTL